MTEKTSEDSKQVVEIKDHEGVFNLIIDQDEISWQGIISELVRSNRMNPWDVDVSLLTQKYLEMLKKLKDLDFRVTGKVVLAAALLLKIKSNRLVGEEIDKLDSLFAQRDEQDFADEFSDELAQSLAAQGIEVDPKELQLIPRTPAARRRKVSIYDLMDALQKAMEVKKRRVFRDLPAAEIRPPEKTKDISLIIKEVYGRIKSFFVKNKNKLTFSQLIPSDSREDKVFTFIPLLHLSNERKVDLMQESHFGEIEVQLMAMKAKEEVEKELTTEEG